MNMGEALKIAFFFQEVSSILINEQDFISRIKYVQPSNFTVKNNKLFQHHCLFHIIRNPLKPWRGKVCESNRRGTEEGCINTPAKFYCHSPLQSSTAYKSLFSSTD
jgi:hypothetical protein